MVTELSLDDAADYRFDNLYRVNWIEKLPDYQYQCLHLPFYQICDTFDSETSRLLKYRIRKLCPIVRFRTGETEKFGGEIMPALRVAAFFDRLDGRVHRDFSVYALV